MRISQQLNITLRNEGGYSSPHFHTLARTVVICSVDGGRSEENEVEAHGVLIWPSLMAEYTICYLNFISSDVRQLISCSLTGWFVGFLVFKFCSSSCILGTNPLHAGQLAKLFLLFFFFTLVIILFTVEKLLNVTHSFLFILF